MLTEKKNNIIVYIVSIGIAVATGLISALITMDSMDIYSSINTPPLSPPSFLFPVVWTILFVLMGISSSIIWINKENNIESAKKGLFFYAVSLAFNFLWSIFFFNNRWFLFSFIWLCALIFFIAATIYFYSKVSKKAAYLQLPYLIWVCFAGYLNLGIYILNG